VKTNTAHAGFSWTGVCNLLDQDSATTVEPLLDEVIGSGKVLEKVFIIDIVDLYNVLLERTEEGRVQWAAQDGDDVGNVCLLESLTPAKSEHATLGLLASAAEWFGSLTRGVCGGGRTPRCTGSGRPGPCR
jgi:hypothetical protein